MKVFQHHTNSFISFRCVIRILYGCVRIEGKDREAWLTVWMMFALKRRNWRFSGDGRWGGRGGGMSGWMQDIGDVQEQDNTQFSSHYVLPFSFQRAFAVCCCYGIHTVTQPHSHTATHTHTRPHTHTHTLSYYLLLLRT